MRKAKTGKKHLVIIQDIIKLFQICQDIEYKREMTIHHASFISYQKTISSYLC